MDMQTIIDSAKAHGITPIIARIIATDSSKAGWQINPVFIEAVDKLVEDNNLPKGPDFYSYFREHPELLGSDGVHPNSDGGGQAMHHLWAEALAPLYAAGDTASAEKDPSGDSTEIVRGSVVKFVAPTISMQNRQIIVQGVPVNAEVSLVSATGTVVAQKKAIQSSAVFENISAGKYIVVIHKASLRITEIVQVR